MTFFAAYGLIFISALPVTLRKELRDREMQDQSRASLREAASESGPGFAEACSKHVKVQRGIVCETIYNNDLADAQARLVVRCGSDSAFVDGDFFLPADQKSPRLVSRSTRVMASHTHHCPVVHSPRFSEYFVDQDNRLCSQVSQEGASPMSNWEFVGVTATVMVFSVFTAALNLLSGAR